MAEEKAVAKKKAKKDTFKWFRELKSEFKKIVWPSGKQLKNNTIVVFVMVIVIAAVIALFDWGFKALLGTVIDTGDPDYVYGEETGDETTDETGDETSDAE